jgi:1-acyl-sn-glycerol-3-phosphate acyltransferase
VRVCNHFSYVNALLIIGACRRPVRFVIYEPIYRMFLLHFIFRAAREVVCIFPEGHLTRDGQVDGFKPGIERIIKKNPVPVVPLALKGLWGSFFSHRNGHAMTHLPRRFWSRVELVAGPALHPAEVTAAGLQKQVMALRGDQP